ncbi:MAG: DNA/RNA nuclease SfsA [Deltaproteobacteria bacterium]|nr:DNA/RNA nuclease SfsA [Deltaproteobacteria bacterium]
MRFPAPLIPGTLVERYKRFLADVRLDDGTLVTAHCTNTGSMLGCNAPGSRVYLSEQHGKNRKLPYTWELIRVGRTLVGINTLAANRLAREGIERGVIRELQGYERLRAEVPTRPGSRLDFLLESAGEQCYVEVKNVTLVVDRIAAFPDAVSERGTKHLKELMRLRRRGQRAVLLFVIQRTDVQSLRPADEIDAEYGRWLRRAAKAGVEIFPYRAKVTSRGIVLKEAVPLRI